MNANPSFLQGQFIVTLTEGDIIPAQEIRAETEYIEISNQNLKTQIDYFMLHSIYEVDENTTLEEILSRPQSQEEKNNLTHVLSGVLEIESLLKEFKSSHPHTRQKIAIFGSASLILTIYPGRVSHDTDVALTSDFFMFCQEKKRKSRGTTLEFSPISLLNHLGRWEERSSHLTLLENHEILILHPLDTIFQKLLRLDSDRFHTNDKPDITKVIQTLNPSKKTLETLFTENHILYESPETSFQNKAFKNNLEWFLSEFCPELTYENLAKTAINQHVDLMVELGFYPKPLPTQDLNKFLKKIPNPSDPLEP